MKIYENESENDSVHSYAITSFGHKLDKAIETIRYRCY